MQDKFNWDSITEIIGSRYKQPPAGAITIAEFAVKQGMGICTARATLTRLVTSGVLECGNFFNKSRWVNYYWPKKSGKKK